MKTETLAILQLMQTSGLGPRSLDRLLTTLDSEHRTLQEFLDIDPEEVVAQYALKEDIARSIHDNHGLALALAERLDELRIHLLTRFQRTYPQRLLNVLGKKAPPVLFVSGNDRLLTGQAAGFSGARDASEQGLRCTAQAARALARHGVVVVSGHAAGVDVTTHRAALEAGGMTVFVLPEGILHFRPKSGLAERLSDENFLAVSEFPPRLPWSVANAMQRNRTLCGLVDALIVVEAGETGGTFAAAESALELGIPLFVLEFPDPAPSAKGNTVLLRRGATPLPCLPGQDPDLTNLFRAMQLDKSVRHGDTDQPTLFDNVELDS